MKRLVLLLWLCALNVAAGADSGVDRAAFNYAVHCRGCHGPNGEGFESRVPSLLGQMGKFLSVEGGREFLVQVPGSANAAVGDEELAQLLNWMLNEFSASELPAEFRHYSAIEVGRLRQEPLMEVDQHRAALVERIPAS